MIHHTSSSLLTTSIIDMPAVPILDADGWFVSPDDIKLNQNEKHLSPVTVAVTESVSDVASMAGTSSSSSSGRTFESTSTEALATVPSSDVPTQEVVPKGIDPQQLVGKRLMLIRRSADHPAVFLSFEDGSEYQVLVDGYDPRHGGCELELSPDLERILSKPGKQAVESIITHSRFTRMSDFASKRGQYEERWTVMHDAFTFKIADSPRWHCISAMRAEYEKSGACTFRTFDDVYLEHVASVPRSPQKQSKFEIRTPVSPSKRPFSNAFSTPSKSNRNKKPKRIVEGSMDVWRNAVKAQKEFLQDKSEHPSL